MPTKREREYYAMGFRDGIAQAKDPLYSPLESFIEMGAPDPLRPRGEGRIVRDIMGGAGLRSRVVKPKRKLSAWNKYVKANSKKPRFRLRSGKLNLKKLGVAFRKTPAGKKKRR